MINLLYVQTLDIKLLELKINNIILQKIIISSFSSEEIQCIGLHFSIVCFKIGELSITTRYLILDMRIIFYASCKLDNFHSCYIWPFQFNTNEFMMIDIIIG